MKCLDKIVTNVKSLPKSKESDAKPSKKDTIAFVEENRENLQYVFDHMDAFMNIVQYLDVYKALIASISAKEVAILNEQTPCKFREASEIPFRVQCACKVDGEAVKSIAQCEECKYRTE